MSPSATPSEKEIRILIADDHPQCLTFQLSIGEVVP
jgi:hypothetical protein